MGRKRELTVTARVVPAGTLAANPANPNGRLTAAERREHIMQALIEGLAGVLRVRAAGSAPPAPPTDVSA